MANRRSFKTDVSFLEKISIGATGTKKVFDNLRDAGHSPIELERGSMSFKIWKEIKIKRVRVPDLFCVKCGKRVESRAKTKLQITMSHSIASQDRGWDFGLDDDDFVALVECNKAGDAPIDWKASDLVQYIQVKHLRAAFKNKRVLMERPKGVEEGFETRITWPSAVASADGEIIKVNSDRIQFRRDSDNRTISLALKKNEIKLNPIVREKDKIIETQIIASVVPIQIQFPCTKDKTLEDYLKMLKSSSLSDRYAAAKALANFDADKVLSALKDKMADEKEHIYIRLEAAASILKRESMESLDFLTATLHDTYLENRLECVIILGEIYNKYSLKLLINTLLDKKQHPEIRAGAAWALGESKNKQSLNALVSVFDEIDMDIKAESARSLFKLSELFSKDIIQYFPKSSEDARAGISWALSKSGEFSIKDLLPLMVDENARKWIAWIVGTQKEEKFISKMEDLKNKDNEVYFATTVLWKILSSWINGLELY